MGAFQISLPVRCLFFSGFYQQHCRLESLGGVAHANTDLHHPINNRCLRLRQLTAQYQAPQTSPCHLLLEPFKRPRYAEPYDRLTHARYCNSSTVTLKLHFERGCHKVCPEFRCQSILVGTNNLNAIAKLNLQQEQTRYP